MEIVIIALIGIVLWYFGSTISAGAETSARMAEKKMEVFETSQLIAHGYEEVKLTAKLTKLQEKERMSMKDIRAVLAVSKPEEA